MDRLTRSALIVGLLAIASLARPSLAAERSISFAVPVGIVRPGDTIMIDVRLTSTGQAINAVDLTFKFPTTLFRIDHISRERSALQLWPEEPKWDQPNGTIHVVGGTPNGMFASDGRLFTIVGTALDTGTITISLETATSGAYLNDGLGTKTLFPAATASVEVNSEFVPLIDVRSATHPNLQQWSKNNTIRIDWVRAGDTQYSYSFSRDGLTLPTDEVSAAMGPLTYAHVADGRYAFLIKSRPAGGTWGSITQRWFLIDATAPEPFQILHPEPSTVDNKNVIAWSTVDRMSGVDHATLTAPGLSPVTVTSPLRVRPEWAGKMLTITVSDQAGNTQSATWVVSGSTSLVGRLWYVLVGCGVVAVLLVWLVWWRRRRR